MTMSPAARALLDAARDGLTPDVDALRRVRGKIGASAATAGTGALIAKLSIVSVVALAIGALALRDRSEVAAPSLMFTTTAHVEQREQRVFEGPPPVAHIEMPVHRASRTAEPVELSRIDLAPPHVET
ncbi:MAG: hypothetical protein H0T65_02875, partial [Deltaproteobacteria bacterium]|nr:hypothetical protein [Deltaproteobacteria bacterium]